MLEDNIRHGSSQWWSREDGSNEYSVCMETEPNEKRKLAVALEMGNAMRRPGFG
jgi:hypothetical protein